MWEDGRLRSGTNVLENGEIWLGQFSKHWLQGRGMRSSASGDKFMGEWDCGNLHGWGVEIQASGDKYIGEWEYNRYHGWGKYTVAITGATLKGYWRAGSLVQQIGRAF
jgi:hypothetical protein